MLNKKYVLSITTILVGLAWLLNSLNVIHGVDWVWPIGLAASGILMVAVGGVDKFSAVAGPFLVIASIFSVLRQTERISVNLEVPVLVLVFGVLMLISQIASLPLPAWYHDDPKE